MTEATSNFEHRLDSLEQQGVDNRNRLVHVERQVADVARNVDSLGTKLDTVVSAVTTVTAQPKFDIYKVVPLIVSIVILVGAASTAVTYIASNINAPAIAEAKAEIKFLGQRLDNGWFKASNMSIRAPGGSVSPQ